MIELVAVRIGSFLILDDFALATTTCKGLDKVGAVTAGDEGGTRIGIVAVWGAEGLDVSANTVGLEGGQNGRNSCPEESGVDNSRELHLGRSLRSKGKDNY